MSCVDNPPNAGASYQTISSITWPSYTEVVSNKSPISNNYVAYTTESIFYAQSGYFVTIVMVQWSNVFACKSRKVTAPLLR